MRTTSRGPLQALATSPTMVGALTTLIVIVAVFLAYNAHKGLPFVPTYRLDAQIPDAHALVRGNEVRIGGARVGLVTSVDPERAEDGHFIANVKMDLNSDVDPLPVDSTVLVRPRSTLALKYVEIRPGESAEGFDQGETIPLASARPAPVELDEFWNMFDEETRKGIRGNLTGFGDALAGRGPDLNDALAELRPLLHVLEPGARNLASPQTRLGDFFDAMAASAAEVAPVAETQAQLFAGLDRTFAAFAEVARPYIQETISKSPPTLDEGNRSLPAMRPFLRHSSEFFTAFRPGARALAETSPAIAAAFTEGAPVLRRSPRLNRELPPTAEALVEFQEADGVMGGLGLLIDTNNVLDPTMRFLTPAQSVCNYLSLLFRNAGETALVGNDLGTWLRFVTFVAPEGPNAETTPSAAPASGPDPANQLHYNPYPNTAAPGQPLECEAGNEVYRAGQTMIGNVPGNQGTRTARQSPDQLRRGGN